MRKFSKKIPSPFPIDKKFDNIPGDEDTRIHFRIQLKCFEYDIIYESWYWDGINAESIIFFNDDIKFLNESELRGELNKLPVIKDKSTMTIKKSGAYTFVNFNFKIN